MAVQRDGKVLIGGVFANVNGTSRNGITRLNFDGTLDMSFTPGAGVSGSSSGSVGASVNAVAVQPDGRVLIGGDFTIVNGVRRSGIARLNADGSVDYSFSPLTGASAEVDCIAVRFHGKIMIGGHFSDRSGSPILFARLNTDGSWDNSFTPNTTIDGLVSSVVLQPDGKVLVGGGWSTAGVNQANARPELQQLHSRRPRQSRRHLGPEFQGAASRGIRCGERARAPARWQGDPGWFLWRSHQRGSDGDLPDQCRWQLGRRVQLYHGFQRDRRGGQCARVERTEMLIFIGGIFTSVNGAGCWNAARLVTTEIMVIMRQTRNRDIKGSATLATMTSSRPVVTYQWYRNGVAIPGATDATLIPNGFQMQNLLGTNAERTANGLSHKPGSHGPPAGNSPSLHRR